MGPPSHFGGRDRVAGAPLVFAAAAAAVVIWGATPAVTKVAVAGLDPLAVGLLRTEGAALVAGLVILMGRAGRPRGVGLDIAVSALCGFIAFPLLFSLGMARTSAAHGALLVATAPIFTGLIAAALERRVPAGRWWLGAALAFGGVLALVEARFGLASARAGVIGDLLVMLSCLAAAAGYVSGARAARQVGAWPVTLWALLLAGLLLAPFLPAALSLGELARWDRVGWGTLVYLSLLSSLLAYAAWYWALARGGIGRTGAIQFAQPLIGLILAIVALGETLTWSLTLGAGMIVGAIALVQTQSNPQRSPP